jgi:hypothetical protein
MPEGKKSSLQATAVRSEQLSPAYASIWVSPLAPLRHTDIVDSVAGHGLDVVGFAVAGKGKPHGGVENIQPAGAGFVPAGNSRVGGAPR